VPALLEARGLVKHLGGRRVVDGVALVCRAGEVLGLLGPNGAGRRPRMKRDIGVCTQNDTFDGDFTVQQNVEDVPPARVDARALEHIYSKNGGPPS
jgi:ABC-type multidrug transport system ATPase subunit